MGCHREEVMAKSVVEEIKYEEGQQNLTEAQIQSIADEAMHEIKEPENKDKWENPAEKEAKEAEALKLKEEDDKKTKEDADAKVKKATDEKAKIAADETAKKEADDKQRAQKDVEDAAKGDKEAQARVDAANKAKADAEKAKEGKTDDKPFQIPAENRSKLIEELALKDSLTLEEAEAQIVKDEATINKYKNNPIEMARALRQSQSFADRTRAELDAVKKAGTTPPAPVINNIKDYVQSQLDPIKDKVVEAYKKEYPELVENQTDDYIYGLIKKEAVDRTLKVMEENQTKLVSAAKEKRANLILGLSDQDKAFLPDIKAIIDRTNDRQIMAKDYDVKYVIEWAKGKQLDRLVKEAEERGFKRGQEQPKILGEKIPGGGNNNNKGEGKGSTKKPSLSDEQKERALNMFDIPGMTDDEKFDAYIEIHPELFKNKE